MHVKMFLLPEDLRTSSTSRRKGMPRGRDYSRDMNCFMSHSRHDTKCFNNHKTGTKR